MFEQLRIGFLVLIGLFFALTLIMNMNPRLPRFPWDIFVDKFGFSLYLPVTTSLVGAVLLMILFSFFA
ncbi:DUF2905 family protein [Candidatus Daviesbacteria bacterium]|nr:DUF2905 family protein [Candidatus Daviesbacteria bacterium]